MAEYLCIYHGNCADGFGAAWAVHQALGSTCEFYPGVYQQDPPDVRGKYVVMVDFCYKPDVLEKMIKDAYGILVIDHHKSAVESVRQYPFPSWLTSDMSDWTGSPVNWGRYQQNLIQDDCENCGPRIYFYFDMNRSGAGMAWDFFHSPDMRPALINHIEDRDLWRFALEGTRDIQANLFSYPYDFDVWDQLMAADVATLKSDGAAIERKHHKDISELLAVTKRQMTIAGHDVPVASLPYTLTSDAGHVMASEALFAACYWDTPDGRVFSLRSREDGLDVSQVAMQFGGGGHKNAAGFKVPRDHELAKS
jgi:oligoribonuclease NrnB/cAMP/cGMP phosphodiesterase (DHH superfamily)